VPEERQNLKARQRPLWALPLQLLQPTETHCGAAAVGMLTAAGARRLQLQATAKRPVRTQAAGLVSMAVGGNCTAGGASAQHTTTNEATRHSCNTAKRLGVTAGGNGSRTAARQHGSTAVARPLRCSLAGTVRPAAPLSCSWCRASNCSCTTHAHTAA
jgi:hypothetical protein